MAAHAQGRSCSPRRPAGGPGRAARRLAGLAGPGGAVRGGRVRVLIGLACRELGDRDGAEMELDAARWVFRQLAAAPDLARVEALSAGRPPGRAG